MRRPRRAGPAANQARVPQQVDRRAPELDTDHPVFPGQTRAPCHKTVDVEVTTIASGLDVPWAVELLPSGRFLITEKAGRLRILNREGSTLHTITANMPPLYFRGQAGLLDVALDKNFASKHRIFFVYLRNIDAETALTQAAPFTNRAVSQSGSRIAVDPKDGNLFVAVGDRSTGDPLPLQAQHLDTYLGKVIHITPEGKPAPGNPSLGLPGTWSMGHRTPQGLTFVNEEPLLMDLGARIREVQVFLDGRSLRTHRRRQRQAAEGDAQGDDEAVAATTVARTSRLLESARPHTMGRSAIAAVFAVIAAAATAHAQNWPQFRGGRAGVAADDPRLPVTWSTTENVAWAVEIPGRSWSSPVVWGEHVFVLTAINVKQPVQPLNAVASYLARSLGGPMSGAAITQPTDEHRWVLYDIDFQSGRIRWERTLHSAVPLQPVHQKNSYASETPVTDGERVYAYLGYAGLFAFDMTGRPVWSHVLPAPKMRTGWGSASSPVLHDGRLYIVNDNEERPSIAAFDARTGRELWRTERPGEGSNWSTPFVWQNALRTEIVTTGTKGVRSYDTSGKLLWELTGMTSIHAVTPVAAHGLLFVSSGYFPDSRRPTYAIKPGAAGDITLEGDQQTNAFIAWSHPTLASAYPSPLVVGSQYYTLMDRGFVTSNDPATGREIYPRQRIAADGGTFSASPWSYNGKIFAVNEDGDTFVIQAGPEFKVLGRNSLGEMTLASPAVANGSLIMRTATKLYRIGSR